jgi:hypothetical protein
MCSLCGWPSLATISIRALYRYCLLRSGSFVYFYARVPARIDGRFRGARLLTANLWFTSAVHDGRHGASGVNMPRCFHAVWSVLGTVAPALRGRVQHLTQQDIGDLLFSLSREYARRASGM